jgi:DNA-binding CsgD family transcriptional regulator
VEEAEQRVRHVLSRPRVSPIARIPALVVAAQLAGRRGEDASELLAAADELAVGTGEQQRLVPVAVARAEAAWLADDPAGIGAAVTAAWPVALAHPRRWVLGELSWWALLAGRPRAGVEPVAEPFRHMLAGRFEAAAAEWARLGCPFWSAVSLGFAADAADARAGLHLADEISAPAVRAALARDRHARGLPVPRGPRATTRANSLGLTAREADVLALVADGLTNAEIAQRLFLSEKTVGHHVSAVLRKTGEPSRARAVAAARRAGLLGGPT